MGERFSPVGIGGHGLYNIHYAVMIAAYVNIRKLNGLKKIKFAAIAAAE